MAQTIERSALSRIPSEVWQIVFNDLDVLDTGKGMVCATKYFSAMMRDMVTKEAATKIAAFPPAWLAQWPDFGSPANRLSVLIRQNSNLSILQSILGASRALFAPLPQNPLPHPDLVPYKSTQACFLLAPFLHAIGVLNNQSVHSDTFHVFLESTDMHYKNFATVDKIVQQIQGWSRLQVLKVTTIGQILGWTLCLLIEEHRATNQDIKEYAEAAILVLLLCGVRPLLEAILEAANASNATVQQAFLRAVQLGVKNDLRGSRELANDTASWVQPCFDDGEGKLSFGIARGYVRWTNTYIQIREGLEDVWVDEDEIKDLVRVDMLFAARRREVLEDLDEEDLKKGGVMAGELVAEASRP